jgi:energy-coupling factor transport system substrate-specific component
MKVESLVCPSCGAGLPENVIRGKLFKCANCGGSLVWPERQATVSVKFGLFLCPECGTDNEQSRKFCRLCGNLLLKECPICEAVYYVGDNYCPNGHNFDEETKRLQEKAEQEKLEEERLLQESLEKERLEQEGLLDEELDSTLLDTPATAPVKEKRKSSPNAAIKIFSIGIGIVLSVLLFMFVDISFLFDYTTFQPAYGLSAFLAALFGPLAGFLVSFLGHMVGEMFLYGSPWWSWVIASGVSGLIFGMTFKRKKANKGQFKFKDILFFNLIQAFGNAVGWIIVAPLLDIVFYQEPAGFAFTDGLSSAVANTITTGIVGTFLLVAWAIIRPKKNK